MEIFHFLHVDTFPRNPGFIDCAQMGSGNYIPSLTLAAKSITTGVLSHEETFVCTEHVPVSVRSIKATNTPGVTLFLLGCPPRTEFPIEACKDRMKDWSEGKDDALKISVPVTFNEKGMRSKRQFKKFNSLQLSA